jgi:hypothetical protein
MTGDDLRQKQYNHEDEQLTLEKINSQQLTDTGSGHDTLCMRYPEIASEIHQLHQILQQGNQNVQHVIDTYLLMYACSDTTAYDIRHLQLLSADALHYNSLPDLTRFICMSFATEKFDGIIAYYMQYLSPLRTKNRLRRTKQVPARCHVESAICLNLIHATVLGLYPRCCKRPLFETRVSLVACLYDLKTSTLARQNAFLLKAGNLLRMAFTEYLLNVRQDFCPVEHNFLCKQATYLENYDVACVNATDSMRQACLQQNNWTWKALNENTGNALDRIARMCRMSSSHSGTVQLGRAPKINLSQIQQACAAHVLSDPVNCGGSAAPQQYIHNAIKVFTLPWNFITVQAKYVCERYKEQPLPLVSYCCKYFCLMCICNGTVNILQKCTKLRIDVQTSKIVCASCNSVEAVIAVNMFGKLLQIHNRFMFACHACTALHEYDPTSPMKCTNTTSVTSPPLQLTCGLPVDTPKQDAVSNVVQKNVATRQLNRGRKVQCKWCGKVCAPRVINILHVPTACILSITLCFKHTPPPHMWKFMHDVEALVRYLTNSQRRVPRHARLGKGVK